MKRSSMSHPRGANEHEPPTQPQGVAKRSSVIRVASAVFGVCVVAAVVADSEVPPGNTAALISDFPRLQGSVKAAIGIALAPVDGLGTTLSGRMAQRSGLVDDKGAVGTVFGLTHRRHWGAQPDR
jgi:hypothetical protein